MGGGYTLLTKHHVNMDAFYRRFSPRKKAKVDLATSALFFVFCIGMLAGAYIWISPSLHNLKFLVNPINAALYYPSSLWVIATAFLLLIQGIAKFIRDLLTIINGENNEH